MLRKTDNNLYNLAAFKNDVLQIKRIKLDLGTVNCLDIFDALEKLKFKIFIMTFFLFLVTIL